MAGAAERSPTRSARYGVEIGLAFQIVDDILDVEGASADLGKTAGKDAAAGKPTYPALFGLERRGGSRPNASTRRARALERAGLGGQLPGDRAAGSSAERIEERRSGSTRCSSSAASPRRANGRGR